MPLQTLQLVVAHYPNCIEGGVLRFWGTLSLDNFEKTVDKWVTRENINLFDYSPVLCAMRSMRDNRKYLSWPDKLRWIESIQKLIKMGADIHRFSESSGISLLHEVLGLTEDPAEIPEDFRFWVLVLVSSNVKSIEYLKAEVDFYYENNCTFIEDVYEYRRVLTLDIHDDGEPHFGWEWWVEPDAPGYEIAKEFKTFSYTPDRKSLSFEEHTRREKLLPERFERKQIAKAAKMQKFQNQEQLQLPGAWID